MIRTHLENKAEATIAALPVGRGRGAGRAGSCGSTPTGRVIDFEEKPKTPEKLDRVRTDPDWLERFGIKAAGRSYLASMGIYLFNRSTLVQLLAAGNATDFGHEIFPQAIANHRVQAHLFDGYWEDIGTVGAFHKANIDLTRDDPPFDFTFGDHPIFTRPRYLPCSRISGRRRSTNSLISDGCVIGKGLGDRELGDRRPRPDRRERRRSATPTSWAPTSTSSPGTSPTTPAPAGPTSASGPNSVIENAIIDKNARIGRNVQIRNEAGVVESEDAAPLRHPRQDRRDPQVHDPPGRRRDLTGPSADPVRRRPRPG